MSDNTIDRPPNTANAALEGRLKDVVRYMAHAFAELNTQSAQFSGRYNDEDLAEITAKTVAYIRDRGTKTAGQIDELSFGAVQIAMDAANERAAKEAADYGLTPSGWVA